MKIVKIITSILIFVLLLSNLYSYATDDGESVIKQIYNGSIQSEATNSKDMVVKIISSILNIVRIVGSTVAVTMLLTVACKYIIASAGDKADVKKYAINYIIGALILFGASGIITLAKNFIDASFSEAGT